MTSVSKGPDSPLRKLILCSHFSGEEWQLPTDDAYGDRLLIGWTTQAPLIDSGVPSSVAHLIAEALCRHSTVTFAKGLRTPAGAGLLPRRWRLGRDFVWVSTRDAEEAAGGIFDDDLFSWDRQGQIVVLSATEDVQVFDERQLALPDDPAMARTLRDLGARAVFLPGVDGDVAGLYAFDSTYGDAVRADMEGGARRLGADVQVVDERAFARCHAGDPVCLEREG